MYQLVSCLPAWRSLFFSHFRYDFTFRFSCFFLLFFLSLHNNYLYLPLRFLLIFLLFQWMFRSFFPFWFQLCFVFFVCFLFILIPHSILVSCQSFSLSVFDFSSFFTFHPPIQYVCVCFFICVSLTFLFFSPLSLFSRFIHFVIFYKNEKNFFFFFRDSRAHARPLFNSLPLYPLFSTNFHSLSEWRHDLRVRVRVREIFGRDKKRPFFFFLLNWRHTPNQKLKNCLFIFVSLKKYIVFYVLEVDSSFHKPGGKFMGFFLSPSLSFFRLPGWMCVCFWFTYELTPLLSLSLVVRALPLFWARKWVRRGDRVWLFFFYFPCFVFYFFFGFLFSKN